MQSVAVHVFEVIEEIRYGRAFGVQEVEDHSGKESASRLDASPVVRGFVEGRNGKIPSDVRGWADDSGQGVSL